MNDFKLAIVATHPVQYNAPLFALMSRELPLPVKVFYTWERGSELIDIEFGREIKWDIPVLEGYEYTFVGNQGSMRRDFFGLKNPTLEKELIAWNASHILFFGWNYRSHLRSMIHLKGKIKIFFRGDSTLLDETKGLKKILRRIFLKWVYHYVDYSLYTGIQNKKYFLAHGMKENQLLFAPHAVENDRFSNNFVGINFPRTLFKIPKEEKILLYAGKFIEKKNLVHLLKVFKKLNANGWNLLLVGNGAMEKDLKTIAQMSPNIYFMDFQNQNSLPGIYQSVNAFILPSKGPGETWGLAVNEAMACNLPVLVSVKCGCAIDLVKDGENGYLFDDSTLERVLMKLFLKSEGELKKMGIVSKNVISEYSYQLTIKNLKQHIK